MLNRKKHDEKPPRKEAAPKRPRPNPPPPPPPKRETEAYRIEVDVAESPRPPRVLTRVESDPVGNYRSLRDWAVRGYREAMGDAEQTALAAQADALRYSLWALMRLDTGELDGDFADIGGHLAFRLDDGTVLALHDAVESGLTPPCVLKQCPICGEYVKSEPFRNRIALGRILSEKGFGEHVCEDDADTGGCAGGDAGAG